MHSSAGSQNQPLPVYNVRHYTLGYRILEPRLLPQALSRLKAWGSFEYIQEALDKFPLLDVYLAGGVLRNIAAGIDLPSKDFDFFIQGTCVAEFLNFLSKSGQLTYGQFGAPRWRLDDNDQFYCDIINIPYFNNGLWRCEDMIDALNQFDFTANSIALDLRTMQILDPQNGVRDAARRKIRGVRFDFPDEPIPFSPSLSRNCVLWMRLVHFSATLAFDLEPITKAWLYKNRGFFHFRAEFEHIFFPIAISEEVTEMLFDSGT